MVRLETFSYISKDLRISSKGRNGKRLKKLWNNNKVDKTLTYFKEFERPNWQIRCHRRHRRDFLTSDVFQQLNL